MEIFRNMFRSASRDDQHQHDVGPASSLSHSPLTTPGTRISSGSDCSTSTYSTSSSNSTNSTSTSGVYVDDDMSSATSSMDSTAASATAATSKPHNTTNHNSDTMSSASDSSSSASSSASCTPSPPPSTTQQPHHHQVAPLPSVPSLRNGNATTGSGCNGSAGMDPGASSGGSSAEVQLDPSFILMSPTASPHQASLLAQLDEANRLLEADVKSTHSLIASSPNSKQASIYSGHSRNASMSSVVSNTSMRSNVSDIQIEDHHDPDDAWVMWGKLVNAWDSVMKKKSHNIKTLVRSGIPHHFRGIVWPLLCNAHSLPLKDQYSDYLKQTSPSEKVIRRDVTRTYPDHELFKEKNGLGQESLFNVMKAYSLFDREVGYCQGSGFIVGLLLMQMPEEEAFAVLVQMMKELNLRALFKPNMAELGLCMFQLEYLIQDQLPDLHSHFQAHGFNVSMFASSWFLTLYTAVLPLNVACRVFDVFFSEGMEVVFRIGLALLTIHHDDLLALDMEGMLQFLQKQMGSRHEQDPDHLINTAFQVKYSNKKMKKLEKEYSTIKTKEQEEQVELRRLRTENRLLRQRIDNLEKETATLADRLIQDQVKHAHKVEEVFILRRDLNTVRDHDTDTSQKLDDVTEQLRISRQQSQSPSSSMSNGSLTHQEEAIHQLEEKLKQMKSREEHLNGTIKELNDKLKQLEHANSQLQQEPSVEIQQLQEELIACKLREAEASLSMKEMQQRVYELEKAWQRHMEKYGQSAAASTSNSSKDKAKQDAQVLANDLMTLRLREGRALGELKEHKQRVMELETQNQICSRQMKRMDDEKAKLLSDIESLEETNKELKTSLKEKDRLLSNLESIQEEEGIMGRIKDAEHLQSIAEMRQKIAELEIQNQELLTSSQLYDTQSLEDRLDEMQEEDLQLSMSKRLQSMSLTMGPYSIEMESDYDGDDMSLTDELKLTDVKLSAAAKSVADRESLGSLSEHSGDGEGLYEFDDATIKRRKHKNPDSLADCLKTPTNPERATMADTLVTPTNNCDKTICDTSDTDVTDTDVTFVSDNKDEDTSNDCTDTDRLNCDKLVHGTDNENPTPSAVHGSDLSKTSKDNAANGVTTTVIANSNVVVDSTTATAMNEDAVVSNNTLST